jgi:hypothetical protein
MFCEGSKERGWRGLALGNVILIDKAMPGGKNILDGEDKQDLS